jgi:hypothetical protein
MTPCPPPSSEDPSLPPRHRLSLEKLRKEALETELWNLDDGTPLSNPEPIHPPSSPDPVIIEPDEPQTFEEEIIAAPYESSTIEPDYLAHPEQPDETPAPYEPAIHSAAHSDLGVLGGIDDWDDADIPIPTILTTQGPSQDPIHAESDDAADPFSTSDGHSPLVPAPKTGNRRKSSISLNEIIAMAGVALVLILIAGFFLINALSGLPRIVDPHQKPDVPISGGHFTIHAVNSYWRVPITAGPNADTVQRGTELIPVLEITATGQDAALRVQFRNSDGAAVGDPITHAVRGETKLIIPSTAGLEDINIHNAYRTNLIDPWTVEILEAPAGTTAGNAFRSLISVPISPNRR